MPHDPVKDERLFFPAAQQFKSYPVIPSLDQLRSYPARQPPLSFWVSGLLLRLRGSLTVLRLFNALLVCGCLLLLGRAVSRLTERHMAYGTMLWSLYALNPYIHLTATHYYTDPLYLFLAMLPVTMAPPGRYVFLSGAALWLVPLVRQYGVIFPAGNFLNEARGYFRRRQIKPVLLSLLPLTGLAGFILLWKGLLPVDPTNDVMGEFRRVHGYLNPYIPAYLISAIGFYLSPAWILFLRKAPGLKTKLYGGAAAVLLYALFPARPNPFFAGRVPAINQLGLYHGTMISAFGPAVSHVALALFAGLGGAGLAVLIAGRNRVPAVMKTWTVLFLVVSLLNFSAWDKYLLDIIPIMLVSLAYADGQQSDANPT
jgi:hypothetical protein